MLRVLDFIEDGAYATGALVAGILEAGYGASMSSMDKSIERNMAPGYDAIQARYERRQQYQLYISTINYLKKARLLREQTIGGITKLYLTAAGRAWRKKIKKERQLKMPAAGYSYSPGKKIVIAIYDIPEKFHCQRDWLRAVLKKIGMKKLQQSVWCGRVLIPDTLLLDLVRLRLQEYVEFIEVGPAGVSRS